MRLPLCLLGKPHGKKVLSRKQWKKELASSRVVVELKFKLKYRQVGTNIGRRRLELPEGFGQNLYWSLVVHCDQYIEQLFREYGWRKR